MPRIHFLNRFYWPDETATAQLLTDLAEALAARGRDVVVIASRPGGAAAPRRETRHGVRIERVGSTRSRRPGLALKALDFGTFYFGAILRLARLARRGDTVVALTDPPLLGVGAGLIARIRGCACVHWVQDIYPEIAIALTARKELRLLRPLRNAAWRQAGACVTLGREMAAVVAGSGIPPEKIHLIANWAPAGLAAPPDTEVAAQRAAWGVAGSFVVAYCGNLGRVHDLDALLEVAAAMRDDRETTFLFAGEGAQRSHLEAEAKRRGLTQVRFLPSQPRESLAAALAAGDVQVVSLRPDCERYVFPSKLAGLAAVGRPVLFLGSPACEPAQVVADHGFGRAFLREEVAGIVFWLRELQAQPKIRAALGAAAQRYARETGGIERSAAAWDLLLAGLRPSGTATPLNR